MADREVNVKVNIAPGQDQLTPALEKQKQAAQGLQNAGGAKPAPAGVSADAWAQAQKDFEAQQQRQQRQDLLNRYRAQVGPSAGEVTQGVLGGAAQAAQSGVMGLVGSLGRLVPGLGAVVTVAASLPSVVEGIRAAFGRLQPTLAETMGLLNRAQADLAQGRQTGLSPADALRRAFQGTRVINELTGAQNAGNPQQQRAILERENARARADVARFDAARPEEAQANVESILAATMRDYRAGGQGRAGAVAGLQRNAFHTGPIAQRIQQLWVQAGNRIEDMPDELRNIDPSTLTPERISELGRSITAGAVGARNRLQATGNALGPGGIPSLRAGVPGIENLPAFQSQRGDVLDIHAQVQQDVIRDQREEARFLAEQNTRNQILAELRRINGGQPPVG